MKKLTSFLVLAAGIVLLAGCASSGYKKAGNTSTSLQKAAHGIDKSNAQLDVVLGALSDLVNNPGADITPQFKTFSAAESKLESLANEVSGDAAAMQTQGTAYFQKWDEERAKIQNEDIRARSSDRKNEVAAHFEKVRAGYVQTRTDFAPFMSDLKDIRTALATDLTTGGLASIKGVVNRANEDAPPLRASLTRLAADFKDLGISLSASTPAN